jgi:hypothetical protein
MLFVCVIIAKTNISIGLLEKKILVTMQPMGRFLRYSAVPQ